MDHGSNDKVQPGTPYLQEPTGNKRPGSGKKAVLIAVLAVAAAAILFSVLLATHVICIRHDWQEATCIQAVTCSKCGREQGEALGHSWKNAACTTPKTCSRCNEKEGKALGHAWQDATCERPKTCSRCAATQGAALEHTTDWKITKAATLSSPGKKEEICQNCGKSINAQTITKAPAVSSQSFNFTEDEFMAYFREHTSSSYQFVNAFPDSVAGIGDNFHGYLITKDGDFTDQYIFVRSNDSGEVIGFLVDVPNSQKSSALAFALHIASLITPDCDINQLLLPLTVNNYCTVGGMELTCGDSPLLGDDYYSTIIIPEGLSN